MEEQKGGLKWGDLPLASLGPPLLKWTAVVFVDKVVNRRQTNWCEERQTNDMTCMAGRLKPSKRSEYLFVKSVVVTQCWLSGYLQTSRHVPLSLRNESDLRPCCAPNSRTFPFARCMTAFTEFGATLAQYLHLITLIPINSKIATFGFIFNSNFLFNECMFCRKTLALVIGVLISLFFRLTWNSS